MIRRILSLLPLLLVLLPTAARAQDLKDRFNIKLSLTGMYEAEQESALPAAYGRTQPTDGTGPGVGQVSSPFQLGYGELRAVIDGRRLPGSFDLHIDGRVRLTGAYSIDDATVGNQPITARGYLGGSEYDLRSAWVRRRGEAWDFGLGRMIVSEADALRIDGARLWWRMAKHWDASIYAGGYSDPYSRSLNDDYSGGFAVAGGGDATYTYDKIWGSFSVNGAYFSGNDDGGTVVVNADGTIAAGKPTREKPRTWLTWTDFIRVVSWLDLYTDVVVDASGDAGAQLTRLDALATIRAGSHLTFRLGYDHLSAFAIEMWMTKLLTDRSQIIANTIENNLTVERTSRDEGRGQVDLAFGKFSVNGEGRVRKRALVSLTDDTQFTNAGKQVAPGFAWDATLGVHDRGSLAGLREGLWAMYLSDYRASSLLVGVDLGRSFWDEKLTIDFSFLYAKTKDDDSGKGTVVAGMPTLPIACNAMTYQTINSTCYGTRNGAEYETGLTIGGSPFNHWYAFVDYRLVVDKTDGNIANAAGTTPALPEPTILTHVLLLRIEARY
ncbi:MAG TPA: hypothetical protein VIA18_25045 [Polyangia bacterium]|jgi:hypothetical protein|nr:hypothetical protein [Polyangia bacterium]